MMSTEKTFSTASTQRNADNRKKTYGFNDHLIPPGTLMFISSLWLPDEAKIETEQEEDEMDDGAATADLRCFDKTRPQQRHRNIGETEIEQNAR
jgi:hypothetical protein